MPDLQVYVTLKDAIKQVDRCATDDPLRQLYNTTQQHICGKVIRIMFKTHDFECKKMKQIEH